MSSTLQELDGRSEISLRLSKSTVEMGTARLCRCHVLITCVKMLKNLLVRLEYI